MHTNMEWSSAVTMVSNDVSIQGSLPTLRTTPKSELYFSFYLHLILILVRVLLATIRDNGNCPCPRCLVPKSILDRLGRVSDMNNRINNTRKYDMDAVNEARAIIYEQGKPIRGTDVEALLKDTSAVPTLVSMTRR